MLRKRIKVSADQLSLKIQAKDNDAFNTIKLPYCSTDGFEFQFAK